MELASMRVIELNTLISTCNQNFVKNPSKQNVTQSTFLKAALALMYVEKQIFTNTDTSDR